MSIPVSIDPLGTLGGDLPPGYVALDSVFFPIGSVAVTTHNVSGRDTLSIRAAVTPNSGDSGGFGPSGLHPYLFIGIKADGTVYGGLGDGYGSHTAQLTDGPHNFIISPTQCLYDGFVLQEGVQPAKGDSWTLSGIRVFWATSIYWTAPTRLYGGTLERDGRIVAKWIPCKRASDGSLHIYEVGETPGFVTITGPVLEPIS